MNPMSELPKVAPGVVFKRTPPKAAPMALVSLLNDAMRVLDAAYKGKTGLPGAEQIAGVSAGVTADWLGERNWQIEISATNALARKELPVGGMIANLQQFGDATIQVTKMLVKAGMIKEALFWRMPRDFETEGPNKVAWSTIPGDAGNDGKPHGVTIVLKVTTKPEVGIDPTTQKGYWEV